MSYLQAKSAAIQAAIDWQIEVSKKGMSWGELAEASAYFERLAARYGLIREFRENGII